MTERWLPIPECPGYEASDQGGVQPVGGLPLRPGLHNNGKGKVYRRVVLRVQGKDKHLHVAGLVLSAHVGPRPAGQVARHLDDNSLNDTLANLAWGTYDDNSKDAARNGSTLFGEKNPNAKLTADDVLTIRARWSDGASISTLAVEYGVHYQHMFRIVHRKRWRHI